jgi:hypothetical protein
LPKRHPRSGTLVIMKSINLITLLLVIVGGLN